MTESVAKQAPLEDLMAAMDVVDTLRHQRGIAERELKGESRREDLLTRLKKLYRAQGIEVPDRVLLEGIDALEQERFQYTKVTPSWRTRVANMWVSRRRWGKPIGFLTIVGSLFSGVYFVNDVLPERNLRSNLPANLEVTMSSIEEMSMNPSIVDEARAQIVIAKRALADDDLDVAKQVQTDLNDVKVRLQREYTVRIISRPNENSGVWRVPDINKSGRNYYLIVEAIDNKGKVMALDVLNEETNKRSTVKTWGIRVNEGTFHKVAADKQDDGIIQSNEIGRKEIGYLVPKFSIATTGGTITKWK